MATDKLLHPELLVLLSNPERVLYGPGKRNVSQSGTPDNPGNNDGPTNGHLAWSLTKLLRYGLNQASASDRLPNHSTRTELITCQRIP